MGYTKQLLNEPMEALDQSDSEEFNNQFNQEHSKTNEILREINMELAQDKDLDFIINAVECLTKINGRFIDSVFHNMIGQKMSCSYAHGIGKLKIISRSDLKMEVFNELTGDCIQFLA